jgi:hypothetical protein
MAAADDKTSARAEEVLRAYGAHAERWPLPDRTAVLGTAREDLHVARVRQGEAALDRLLDRAPSHVAPADLVARIQAAALCPPAAEQTAPGRWRTAIAALLGAAHTASGASAWRPAWALGAAMILGLFVGSVWTPVIEDQVAAADFLSMGFGSDFESSDPGDAE